MSEKRDSGGPKGSSWRTARRCLNLLQRLMREPASGAELRQIIIDHAEDIGDGQIDGKALERRFEEDRVRLREWFGCDIKRDPETAAYTLKAIEYPLIDLSEEAREGLAFLRANFSSPNTLMGEEVRSLIEQITRIVPSETQKAITKRRKMIEMDVVVQHIGQIPDNIWFDIEATIGSRRLAIHYQDRQDSQPWWYDIEPERWFEEGKHLYLYGRCHAAHNPDKKNRENTHIRFRIDRIHQSRPLPEHFTPTRPRTYELEFQLAPELARNGVTELFKNQHVFYLEDDSAKVKVASENLFVDLRKLLRYGPLCQVIGGAEAVAEMKRIVRDLAKLYD